MNNNHRMLSFPGTAHIPACRVRFDSPHFGKFRKLAQRLFDRMPDLETGTLRAYDEGKRIALHTRSGLMFNVTYTSTILHSIISSMEGEGKPGFYGRTFQTGDSEVPGTVMLPSFWDLVMLMERESENTGLDDMMALEEQGVLVRSRKVPIAMKAIPGGLYARDDVEIYSVIGKPIPMMDVVMLGSSGAASLVKEIILVEAAYEASREGGRFCGQPQQKIRRSMSAKFRYEVFMSLKDVDEPIDLLSPQS